MTEHEAIEKLANLVSEIAARSWEAIGTDGVSRITSECVDILRELERPQMSTFGRLSRLFYRLFPGRSVAVPEDDAWLDLMHRLRVANPTNRPEVRNWIRGH